MFAWPVLMLLPPPFTFHTLMQSLLQVSALLLPASVSSFPEAPALGHWCRFCFYTGVPTLGPKRHLKEVKDQRWE